MASLGQELKRERELRGISLREIADTTRIGLKYLQAIEDDQFHLLPGSFFIRAILRSYAKAIGLDENQVLNRYQEIQCQEDETIGARVREKPRSRVQLFPRTKRTLIGVAILVSVSVLLLVVVRWPEKKPVSPSSLPEVSTISPAPAPAVESSNSQPALPEKSDLEVEALFAEETWIRVLADGVLVFEGIKSQGESLRFSGLREMELSLGNAGGLTMFINGQKAKPFGPRGTVRKDIKITLDNYEQFLLPPEKNQTPGQR